MLAFVLQWLSMHSGILMLLSQFPLTFNKTQKRCPFHIIDYDYSCADWDAPRDVAYEDLFKLGASAAAEEFCEWVQVGIDVYILHHKYQVNHHSLPKDFSSLYCSSSS